MLVLLDHLKSSVDIEEVQDIYLRINRTADEIHYARARYMLVDSEGHELDLYNDLDEGDIIRIGSAADYPNLKKIKVQKDYDLNIRVELDSTINNLTTYSVEIDLPYNTVIYPEKKHELYTQ